MGARDDLRIGFIGCGLIARSHARGLADVAGVSVVACTDVDRHRAEVFAADVAGTGRAALDGPEAVIEASDAVYVCTWTAAHPEAVAAVVAAGKPVFCEKPLAVDLEGAVAMTDAVRRSGVVNQVGLVLRHSPAFRWLAATSASAGVGPLMNIVFRDDQFLPIQGLYDSTWRADPAKAGAGALLEHSIHDLDLLGWLMGPIASVAAVTGAVHGLDGIEDQATVLLVADSGAQASLTSVWHDVLSRPSQRRVEVFCQDAVLQLEGDWRGPVSIETTDRSPTDTALEGRALAERADRLDGLTLGPDASFVEAVRSGQPAYPSFEEALTGHQLVDAAYRSAADGGRVVRLGGPNRPEPAPGRG